MSKSRIVWPAIVTLLSVGAIHTFAHSRKNTTTSPAYQLAEQADTPLHYTDSAHYIYDVPEFYFYGPRKYNDTTIEFFCYDYRDSLINTVTDYDDVHYYSLYKSYIDSDHTYKDDNGVRKPLPVSGIIKRYDRITKNKWMSIEYPGNKYVELTEFRDIIVNTQTLLSIDTSSHKSIERTFNYYRVVK